MLQDILDFLRSLYGLPATALTAIFCLAVGYIVRFIKTVDNKWIPLIVVHVGAALNLILAEPMDAGEISRHWWARNIAIGYIIGLITWLLHNKVLKQYEDKIPFLGPLLAALDADQPDEPDKPKPPTPTP